MLKLDFKNIHIIPPAGLIRQHLFKRVLKSVFIQHAVKLYWLCNTSHGLPWLTLLWQQSWALFIGVLSRDKLDSGLQSMSRDTHRSRNSCSGPNQPAPWNKVTGVRACCSPGHAGPQRGCNQLVGINLEAVTADDLMLSWSLASYMTSRKVLSANWAVKCFQRGYSSTTCFEDVRNLFSPKLHVSYEGMRKKPNTVYEVLGCYSL